MTRLVARVPADERETAAAAAAVAVVVVVESDAERPERGATALGYARDGALVSDTWYVTAEEAMSCVATTCRGRLGPWRPLPAGVDPVAMLEASDD